MPGAATLARTVAQAPPPLVTTPAGWHFSSIIGTGTPTDPYRPVAGNYRGISWRTKIPCDAAGVPLMEWALVETNPSLKLLDQGLVPNEALPKVSRTESVGDLRASVLAKFGVVVSANATLGEIVAAIAGDDF